MKTHFVRSRDAGVFTPAQVPNVTATVISPTEIDLTWGSIVNVQNYTVRRNGDPIVNLLATAYADTGLSPNTTYTYTVAAINAFGEGQKSVPIQATTPPAPQAPGQVTGLATTTVSTTVVGLIWNAVPNTTTYSVVRNGVTLGTTANAAFTDNTVAANTTYQYVVTAINGVGAGSPSSPLTVATPPNAGGSIVINGGIWVILDYNQMLNQPIGNLYTRMDQLVALLGTTLVGFIVFPHWGNLEGPTQGDFTGDWSTDTVNFPKGYQLIDGLLAKCASYNPQRKLQIHVYTYGGAVTPGGQTTFPSPGFLPNYLSNTSIYGADTHTTNGQWAGAWISSVASQNISVAAYPRYWDQSHPILGALLNMSNGYANGNGTHPGYNNHPLVDCFSPLDESAIASTLTGYPGSTNELAMFQALFLGPTGYFATLRAQWQTKRVQWWGNYLTNYTNFLPMLQACMQYKISVGSPDIFGTKLTACQNGYLGLDPTTGVVNPSYQNLKGVGDYIAIIEPIDLNGSNGTVQQLWTQCLNLGALTVAVWDNTFSGPASNQFPALATTLINLAQTQPLPTAYPTGF